MHNQWGSAEAIDMTTWHALHHRNKLTGRDVTASVTPEAKQLYCFCIAKYQALHQDYHTFHIPHCVLLSVIAEPTEKLATNVSSVQCLKDRCLHPHSIAREVFLHYQGNFGCRGTEVFAWKK